MNTMLDTHFSDVEQQPFLAGLRIFVRMLVADKDYLQMKFSPWETDLADAFKSVNDCITYSQSMIGKKMYANTPFDHVEDCKREMEALLLEANDERSTAIQRKKHMTMYHLVVEPYIEMFRSKNHVDAIQASNDVLREVIELVVNSDQYGNSDDAIVAKHQAAAIVSRKAEMRKEELASRKRRKRKDTTIEIVEDATDEQDTEDAT